MLFDRSVTHIEKAMAEHDARFTWHVDFEQAITLLVQSMSYLKATGFTDRWVQSSPLKKPNAPSMIELSIGTSAQMVARRCPCPCVQTILQVGHFALTCGCAHTCYLNETQSPVFTMCQLKLSWAMPQQGWGDRALQEQFLAGSWSWGQGHSQGHFLYWYRHTFSRQISKRCRNVMLGLAGSWNCKMIHFLQNDFHSFSKIIRMYQGRRQVVPS